MRRLLALALLAVLAACNATPVASPTPGKTPDIKRANLDIIYTQLTSSNVHKPTSKQVLTGGLDAVRAEVKSAGGKDDVATPEFTDSTDTTIADSDKFLAAVSQLASENPGIAPARITQAAITGLLRSSPDCHTYYLTSNQQVILSNPYRAVGNPNPPPPSGVSVVGPPDSDSQLQAKILDGGVAWVSFKAFAINGTYDIRAKVMAAMDAALAKGATAWLFDLRGNVGGNGADTMASWFLNGEPMYKTVYRDGSAIGSNANKDLRLPAKYQLPIAIILNDRGGSAPEVFSLALKENRRAEIVGHQSAGCLGATTNSVLSDGSQIFVVVQEYIGGVTGAKYNNAGIPPDIQADDASAVDIAAKYLRDQLAKK